MADFFLQWESRGSWRPARHSIMPRPSRRPSWRRTGLPCSRRGGMGAAHAEVSPPSPERGHPGTGARPEGRADAPIREGLWGSPTEGSAEPPSPEPSACRAPGCEEGGAGHFQRPRGSSAWERGCPPGLCLKGVRGLPVAGAEAGWPGSLPLFCTGKQGPGEGKPGLSSPLQGSPSTPKRCFALPGHPTEGAPTSGRAPCPATRALPGTTPPPAPHPPPSSPCRLSPSILQLFPT